MLNLGASLYSFQDDMLLGRTDLEGALATIAKLGGTGVEMVPQQSLTDVQYWTIDPNFVAQWNEWMDKYHLTPTNCNLYDEYDAYPNRMMTLDERYQDFKHGVELAKAMGFTSVRGCPDMPNELLERCIKICEYYGVTVSLEVHAPFSLKSDWMMRWFDLIEKTGTEYAGIHPDAAIFSIGPHLSDIEVAYKQGANPDIVEFIKEEMKNNARRRAEEKEILTFGTYESTLGYGTEELQEKVRAMGGGEPELALAGRLTCDDPRWLVEYKKYIKYFHGKFYDMVDDGNGSFYDPSINYEGVIQALLDIDYKGFIVSEYEGMNAYHAVENEEDAPPAEEMIRKEMKMIRDLEQKLTC